MPLPSETPRERELYDELAQIGKFKRIVFKAVNALVRTAELDKEEIIKGFESFMHDEVDYRITEIRRELEEFEIERELEHTATERSALMDKSGVRFGR